MYRYSAEQKRRLLSPAISRAKSEHQQRARTNGETRTPRMSRDGWATLCCGVLLSAGIVALISWAGMHPHRPRFTVAALSVAGGRVAFNVSDRNPNRHFGIAYKGRATRASLLFHEAIIASSPAFAHAHDWYQPSMSTTYIADVIDGVEHSFNATLRAEPRLSLRLQLTTAISFRRYNTFGSDEQSMLVSCDLLVGADGSLLRESVGAPCHILLDD